MVGGQGQTGGARWQWSLENSEWPGFPAGEEWTKRVDWGLRKMLFRDEYEQRSRVGHAYARLVAVLYD